MYLNSNNHNLHQSQFIEKIEILKEKPKNKTKNDLEEKFLAESQRNLNDKNRLTKKNISN